MTEGIRVVINVGSGISRQAHGMVGTLVRNPVAEQFLAIRLDEPCDAFPGGYIVLWAPADVTVLP